VSPEKGERDVAKGLYDVWHLKADVAIESQESGSPVRFPADYEHVARVKALSLDQVYEKTNSMDGPWWLREGVQCVRPSRSTSIDDVVIGPAGDIHVLGWNGWMLVREAQTPVKNVDAKPTIEPSR
jgi:hypothetical protein